MSSALAEYAEAVHAAGSINRPADVSRGLVPVSSSLQKLWGLGIGGKVSWGTLGRCCRGNFHV